MTDIKALPEYEVLLYHMANGSTSAGIFVGSSVYGDGQSTIYTETVVPVEFREHPHDRNKRYVIQTEQIKVHRIFMDKVIGVSVLGEMAFDGDDSLIPQPTPETNMVILDDPDPEPGNEPGTGRIHGVPV